MNDSTNIDLDYFPGFEVPVNQISKFVGAGALFTMLLLDKTVIHFEPYDRYLFKEWLLFNEVVNIKG